MTTLDLIPSSKLHQNWIEFVKTIDDRIKTPKDDSFYQIQINLILNRMRAMKENGTCYVKLDEGQQEILIKLLQKELGSELVV